MALRKIAIIPSLQTTVAKNYCHCRRREISKNSDRRRRSEKIRTYLRKISRGNNTAGARCDQVSAYDGRHFPDETGRAYAVHDHNEPVSRPHANVRHCVRFGGARWWGPGGGGNGTRREE
ncbi:unnamed protein product [Macrosiphum euphorbiae]|uniref:Uncharacterized protein n=1 Tax=Macrosiphum euphorbiae TaxID=13131 RepID=A0AAV0W890_9HEMI|nr:unnamed protein product [Macrosiphum euphorbiae]